MDIVNLASNIAENHFKGIYRKGGKIPYNEHNLQVVDIINQLMVREFNKTREPSKQFSVINDSSWYFRNEHPTVFKAVCWLHDVLEYPNAKNEFLTREDLIAEFYKEFCIEDFRYSTKQDILLKTDRWFKVVEAVELLTEQPKNCRQNYVKYLDGICENVVASYVKLCDLRHNMSNLEYGSLYQKYQLTEWYILNHMPKKSS